MSSENRDEQENILLRLYAGHSGLFAFTTNSGIISYLEKLLLAIPGVEQSNVCLIDPIESSEKVLYSKFIGNINLKKGKFTLDDFNEFCQSFEEKDIQVYPVKTADIFFGVIAIKLNNFNAFQTFDPVVNTFAISISFILENKFQKYQLEENNKELTIHKKNLAKRVKSQTKSLNTANKKLEKYTAELEKSNQELQQFAYIASHDLQEPLRVITSYLQLIERRYKNTLDKDAEEFIAFAVDGANRLQKMIEDLLVYSRVQTRGENFEKTDCNMVIHESLINLKLAIEDSHTKITYDNLPTVMGDKSQLIQLFQNLLSNSIKFHKPGVCPVIHISAKLINKEWVFCVHDNGIGIDPMLQDKLFIMFKHLAGKEYPGNGIGLAVCKRIVERHKGRIWVESDLEKGTTFYFALPEDLD